MNFPICFTEMMVANPPTGLEDFRFYRIEYGGFNEQTLMESMIWVPPWVSIWDLEDLFNPPSLTFRLRRWLRHRMRRG